MSDALSWPAGYSFNDRRLLTRGACAGNLAVDYSPGAGNEFLVEGGEVINQDTVARVVRIDRLNTSGTRIHSILREDSLGAGLDLTWPNPTASDAEKDYRPWGNPVIAGTQKIRVQVTSVAATEDAVFGIALRCLHNDPTITEVNA